MTKIPIVLLLLTLVVGLCSALWPDDGLHYCAEIVHGPTATACTDCFSEATEDPSNTDLTKSCMTQYMPPYIARCAKHLGKDKKQFNNCAKNSARSQGDLDQRTRHLYSKAGKMLDVVLNADHVPHGPQGLLSCMAQNILLYADELKTTLRDVASECWDRFEEDPKNAEWHLNTGKPWRSPTRSLSQIMADMAGVASRNMVFEYGSMGHTMPFHGVGPLSVDYLKGECVIKDIIKHDRKNRGTSGTPSLQTVVDTLIKYDAPVPAWVFREMMNNIDLITFS